MNSARCPRVLQDGGPVWPVPHPCHSALPVQSVWFIGTAGLWHHAWQGPGSLLSPQCPASLSQSVFSPQTGKGTPVFTIASQNSSRKMPDFEGRLANNNKQKQRLPCFHTEGIGPNYIDSKSSYKRRKKMWLSLQLSCPVVPRVTAGEIK